MLWWRLSPVCVYFKEPTYDLHRARCRCTSVPMACFISGMHRLYVHCTVVLKCSHMLHMRHAGSSSIAQQFIYYGIMINLLLNVF